MARRCARRLLRIRIWFSRLPYFKIVVIAWLIVLTAVLININATVNNLYLAMKLTVKATAGVIDILGKILRGDSI